MLGRSQQDAKCSRGLHLWKAHKRHRPNQRQAQTPGGDAQIPKAGKADGPGCGQGPRYGLMVNGQRLQAPTRSAGPQGMEE